MKLSNEIIIDASADRLWDVVAHQFAQIGEWATAIAASRPKPAGADADAPPGGRVCDTGMRMFAHVEETILAYDESARTLTYAGAGLPRFVSAARNRWQVIPLDDHRACVRVVATMETRGITGRLLAIPLRVWLTREGHKTLDDLRHCAEDGYPSPRKQRRLASSRAYSASESEIPVDRRPTARAALSPVLDPDER